MSIIFKSGLCTKGNLYDEILKLLREGGWTTVNRTTIVNRREADRDVLQSTGVSGKRNLILHLRHFWNTNNFNSTNTLNSNLGNVPAIPANTNVRTTNANIASIRLLKSFTAGSNLSGANPLNSTFNRNTEPLIQFMLAPGRLAIDAIIEYKYAVNKDRLILVLFYPAWSNFKPIIHYIGIPDNVFLDNVSNNELMYASSFMSTDTADSKDIGYSWVVDAPAGWPLRNVSEKNYVYNLLATKNPNASSKYMVSKSYYGTDVYGIRGEFSGLYVTKNENLHTKEIIEMDDGKTLEVAICHEEKGFVNSFGSSAIAYEINRKEEEKQILQARINLERIRVQEQSK